MKRWLPMECRGPLFSPNDDWSTGNGGGGGAPSDPKDAPTGDKDKDTPEHVPYSRFAEVNNQKKELETQLEAYRKKEAEEVEKKKNDEEAEAKKRGEYEKLIEQKDKELADYKSKQEAWTKREEALTAKNTKRIEALKAKLWEDWTTAESLIADISDPYKLEEKLDAIEVFRWVPQEKTPPKGGGDLPWGGGKWRLNELKEILNKGGRLTAGEQREFFRLAHELEQK